MIALRFIWGEAARYPSKLILAMPPSSPFTNIGAPWHPQKSSSSASSSEAAETGGDKAGEASWREAARTCLNNDSQFTKGEC